MKHRFPAIQKQIPTRITLCVLALAALAGGCSSGPRGQKLKASDFAAAEPVARPAPADGAASTENGAAQNGPMRAPVEVTGPVGASEGIMDVVATPGPPTLATGPAKPVSKPVLVDAKVGDVNGRPIYAAEFLEPMASRLRAQAVDPRTTPAEWRKFARAEIQRELDLFIEDELLRAEALASLTPEQRQGFFAFLEDLTQDELSKNRGSREAANRSLMASQGKNLDEWMKDEEQKRLLEFQLGQKIYRRVNVSWRDIKQTYERFYNDFNPPLKARFRLVQIAAENEAGAAEFALELTKGVPFGELAKRDFNRYKPDLGGLEEKDFKGDRAVAEFFPNPELNAAARTLADGATAGPFTSGSNLVWLHLEGVIDKSVPLEKAQLSVENYLRELWSRRERAKYIGRLRARASITSVDEMLDQLCRIAEERYLAP
jgi:hypothetical protein